MTEQDRAALPALQKTLDELRQIVDQYANVSQDWDMDQTTLAEVNAAIEERANRIDKLGQPIRQSSLRQERRRLRSAVRWRFTHSAFRRVRMGNYQRRLIHLALKAAYVPAWVYVKLVGIAHRIIRVGQQGWQQVVLWYRQRVWRSRTHPHPLAAHNRRLIRIAVMVLVLEIVCIVGLILLVSGALTTQP